MGSVSGGMSWELRAGIGGGRLAWEDVPAPLRRALETWLGSRIVRAQSQSGGFSPGVAAVLTATNGQRVFVKAAGPSPNPDAPGIHRREIAITRELPATAPVPRLLWSLDDPSSGWVLLAFQEIDGAPPRLPWRRDELLRVLDAIAALAEELTPSPLPAGAVGDARDSWLNRCYWRRFAAEPSPGLDAWAARNLDRLIALEDQVADILAGDTLLHLDIRADNLLVAPDRVYVVDWPHARLGAVGIDVLLLAPSVAMQGGPEPDDLLTLYRGPLPDPERILPVVAAAAGFFTWGALQPPPPGLPFLRAFQAAQGEAARRWLAEWLKAR